MIGVPEDQTKSKQTPRKIEVRRISRRALEKKEKTEKKID